MFGCTVAMGINQLTRACLWEIRFAKGYIGGRAYVDGGRYRGRKEGRNITPTPPPYGGTRNSPVGYMAWWVDTVVPVHAGGKWMLGPLLWEFVSLQLAHIG